jgi:hypothetical protein
MNKAILTILFLLFFVCSAFGASKEAGLVLDTESGAKPASLANAFTASQGGSESIWYNPAGLAGTGKTDVKATYFADVTGMMNTFLSASMPLNVTENAGVGLAYSSAGEINNAVEGGPVQAYDADLVLNYSRILTNEFKAGLNLKYLYSRLANFNAQTISADLGMIYTPVDFISAGLAIRNFFGGLKYDTTTSPLPFNIGLGLGVKAFDIADNVVSVNLDGKYDVVDADTTEGIGIEYAYAKELFLRAGYIFENNSANGITLGAGIKMAMPWGALSIDYAFLPAFMTSDMEENRNIVTVGVNF